MKFLIDEDVPLKLMNVLSSRGHNCVRVRLSSEDLENAKRAKAEERIHPPYADAIIKAMENVLRALGPSECKGLIIVEKSGHIRLVP